MEEEAVYVRTIGEILESLDANPRSDLVHRKFCVYYFPCARLWFFENHEVLGRDLYFEHRASLGNNAHLVGWHNVEVFGVPTGVHGEDFVLLPDWWKSGLEPSSFLNDPPSCSFVYFSNNIHGYKPDKARNVWRMSRS